MKRAFTRSHTSAAVAKIPLLQFLAQPGSLWLAQLTLAALVGQPLQPGHALLLIQQLMLAHRLGVDEKRPGDPLPLSNRRSTAEARSSADEPCSRSAGAYARNNRDRSAPERITPLINDWESEFRFAVQT